MNDAATGRRGAMRRVTPTPVRKSESGEAQEAALHRLADALGSRDFATTLVTGPGHTPRLTVASRHAPLAEDIYANRLAYWWSWAERISDIDDPLTAAHKVATVLRVSRQPGG